MDMNQNDQSTKKIEIKNQKKPSRNRKKLFLIFLFVLSLGIVLFFGYGYLPVKSETPAISYKLATQAPNSTPTATPFQPIPQTPTVIFNELPPESTGEAIFVDISTPGAINQSIASNKNIVKIALLGSDQRPEGYGFRTDVIMLVIINKKQFTASVVSFPRDLYVTIPGWTTQRINTAMGNGGFEMFADTMEYNFGIRPDFYVLTNFWSFVKTVDNLGGIDVQVPEALYDKCEPPKTGTCSVDAGLIHMDGETALWYVRSRRTTNDFQRTKRGREVLKTIFLKLMSLDAVTRFPELYEIYRDNIETNMEVEDMLRLLPVAPFLAADTERMRSFGITQNEVTPFITYEGAQVLLPDQNAIHQILLEAVGEGQ